MQQQRKNALLKAAQLEQAFVTVFGEDGSRTEAQSLVLDQLVRRFRLQEPMAISGSVNPNDLILAEGKRQVVLFILDAIGGHLFTRNLKTKEQNNE